MISDKKCCLIGLLILRFAQSFLFSWGKCNLYYFSYYISIQPNITIDYNTIVVSIMAFFGGLLTIFSLQIAQKIGFLFHIRLSGILQCVCLLISPYTQNYILFLATFYVLFGILEFVSGYPAINCLWSFYKGREAIIQGIISATVGLGVVIFIALVTYLVNPNNERATIQVENGKNEFEYFNIDVAQNVPIALKKITIGLSVMIFIGSFMIRKKSLKSQNFHQVNTEEFSAINPPIMESFEIEKQTSYSVLGQLTFKEAVLSKDFLLVQSMNIILMYFAITLSINYKVYALSKVNDDYFVTSIDLIAQINSAFSNLLWGYLSHKLDYRKLLMFIFIMSGITGMLLPIYGDDKITFAVLYIGVNIFERAVGIITLPAYLKLFGNYMGKRIFPITFISSMIAATFSPLTNIFLIKFATYDQIFIYSSILVLSISLIPLALTRVPIS